MEPLVAQCPRAMYAKTIAHYYPHPAAATLRSVRAGLVYKWSVALNTTTVRNALLLAMCVRKVQTIILITLIKWNVCSSLGKGFCTQPLLWKVIITIVIII